MTLAGCLASFVVLASCSSTDDPNVHDADDGSDASTSGDTGAPSTPDTGAEVASNHDGAPFAGEPRTVACTTPPCAITLVGSGRDGYNEPGFCVLLQDRTVACWGADNAGQLGRAEEVPGMSSPTAARVVGLSDVTLLARTCAIDGRGAIHCWGTGPFLRNGSGELTTERTPIELPLPPATSVSVGSNVGCALVDADTFCWGSNYQGQIAPFDVATTADMLPATKIAIPDGSPIRRLFVGDAVFAVRDDRTVLSWGANPPLARVSSLFPDPYPKPITLTGVLSFETLQRNAAATVGGVGYTWGVGGREAFPLERALPSPVETSEPIVALSAPTDKRWCAIGASGDVHCAGENSDGQAGDGTKNFAYHAVKVEGLPAPAVTVVAVLQSTCALLTTGKVFCWGSNAYGQLGNGKLKVPSAVPEEVVLP